MLSVYLPYRKCFSLLITQVTQYGLDYMQGIIKYSFTELSAAPCFPNTHLTVSRRAIIIEKPPQKDRKLCGPNLIRSTAIASSFIAFFFNYVCSVSILACLGNFSKKLLMSI